MKTVLILSVLTIISLLSHHVVSQSPSQTRERIRPRFLQIQQLGSSSNLTNSRNNSTDTGRDHPQYQSADTPVGVFVGVGCGILLFFGILIYLLSKRKPKIENSQALQSPVLNTEQVDAQDVSSKSAHDETDPNPVQGLRPLTLEALLSFEVAGSPRSSNVLCVPEVTRYFTYQDGSGPSNGNPSSRPPAGSERIPSLSPEAVTISETPTVQIINPATQARTRGRRVNRQKNTVPTLVTINMEPWSPKETTVDGNQSVTNKPGFTFKPQGQTGLSRVSELGSESSHSNLLLAGRNNDVQSHSTSDVQVTDVHVTRMDTQASTDTATSISERQISTYKPYRFPVQPHEHCNTETIPDESESLNHLKKGLCTRTTLQEEQPLQHSVSDAIVNEAAQNSS